MVESRKREKRKSNLDRLQEDILEKMPFGNGLVYFY
jgi:hypothetical protein